MDQQFVSSVASIGDRVEIRLTFGDLITGVLTDLTSDRLTVVQENGAGVTLMLSLIALVRRSGPEPQAPSPVPLGSAHMPAPTASIPPVPVPEPKPASVPEPEPEPGPAPESEPGPEPESEPAPEPDQGSAPEPTAVSPVLEPEPSREFEPIVVEAYDEGDEDPLELLAQVSVLPIRARLIGAEQHRGELESICNSLVNAERIHELSPRFGRVPRLYRRAKDLQRRDPHSTDMYYLCGVLGILSQDYEGARPYLSTGADLDSDPECLRLLAIASAHANDQDTAAYALIRYFRQVDPDTEDPLWTLLVRILDYYRLGRNILHELRALPRRNKAAQDLVETALAGTVPPSFPVSRPKGAKRMGIRRVPAQESQKAKRQEDGPSHRVAASDAQEPRAASGPRRGETAYQWAKRLENRDKNLAAAKLAYREAIAQRVRTESAVKDLAWLTRRTDGPVAALEVITREFPHLVKKGDALDNILIDFHVGAGNHDEALVILLRQLNRVDIADAKRNHLRQQVAYVKFTAGKDSIADWETVVRSNPTAAARRGLALALIQSGKAEDLERAEDVIAPDDDDKARDIRSRINQIRAGESSGVDPRWASKILGKLDQFAMTSLVDFVMEHYSTNATKIRDQRKREGKKLDRDDAHRLAEGAQRQRGRAREGSADGYISAAVLAWETGRDDFLELLCSGLTGVADIVLEQQVPEAARGLYIEAMRVSERLDEQTEHPDARLALSRFLSSLDGRRALMPRSGRAEPQLEKIISQQFDDHNAQVFDLVTQLVSQVDMASDQVLDAIWGTPELRNAALVYLSQRVGAEPDATKEVMTRAWRRLGEREAQKYPEAIAQLQFLQDIRLNEDVLDNTAERLEKLSAGVLDPALLRRLADGLRPLRDYLYETSFEDREASLRRTAEHMRLIKQEIVKAPTTLAVEVVWPVCTKIERTVEQSKRQLNARHPAAPTIGQELATSTVDKSGVITVQINVGNKEKAAPLESPTLIVTDDPRFFQAEESMLPLPSAVRGGQHHVQVVRLKATPDALAAGAFSLEVSLQYNVRYTDETQTTSVKLPIRVLSGDDFRPIKPNPFREGAMGKTVENSEMFIGRDEVLRRILERFDGEQSPGSGVAIFGQKRAGKSSIRIHLRSMLEARPDFIVVDMENVGLFSPAKGDEDSRRLIAEILWSIITAAERAVRSQFGDRMPEQTLSAGWTKAEFVAEYQPVLLFIDLVRDYMSRWPAESRPTLIVLIDEFQYFDEWIRTGQLSPSFMQSLKAIIERRMFHLVIVGQDAIERLIAENANVFGVFASERVTYLDASSAALLIDRPIRDNGQSRYRGVAIDRIIKLTGGSAFYIQKFCYSLVEYMNEQQAPLVTEADVELVRRRFLRSLRVSDFDNLETAGYTDPDQPDSTTYRKVLEAVALAAKDDRATYDRIVEFYRGSAELRPLLDDLVLRDVLREESGAYWIVVRLYQDWVLSRIDLDRGSRT
ncbi:ATP-binding protein [Nocardia spumae]|uniref:ATP-binding protein n=1 Tax=Nocardia spumae TaxID=2887190 RepID=UPI001D142B8A|nr:ATP-binding protein [Nocardia spumae]